jgi:hypothetical protein
VRVVVLAAVGLPEELAPYLWTDRGADGFDVTVELPPDYEPLLVRA